MSHETPECPHCGAAMTMRTGHRGDFWGCTMYPRCMGTRRLDDAEAPRDERAPSERVRDRDRHRWRDG